MADLIAEAMNNHELAVLVRSAAKKLSEITSTMDIVVPAVHVEQPDWLAHLNIQPGTGASILAQDGYLSGPAFHWSALAGSDPRLGELLAMERKLGQRVRPDRQALLAVFHADGGIEVAWFELAGSGDRRDAAEEFAPDDHEGYS